MMEQQDIPKVVAAVVEHYIDRLLDLGKVTIKNWSNKMRLSIKSAFTKYLSSTISRYSVTKTIVFRNSPKYLYDFYVPIDLELKNRQLQSPTLADLAKIGNHIVVTGTGGSGKSMLMRHFLLTAAQDRLRIPVYIELRNLNYSEDTITDHFLKALDIHKFNLPREYAIKGLERGYFALLLDGFDELRRSRLNSVESDLLELADRYPDNLFVVSSRPLDRFLSWERFHQLSTMPLTLDKAVELVSKIDYAHDIKSQFLKRLKQDLYTKHQSFLSNPLLLTIMLLTYEVNADIPSKVHVFYAQAFDALYNQHDATKAGFKRELQTKMAPDDFKTVFSAFSILTYDDHRVAFSKNTLTNYLRNARKITGFKFAYKRYIDDLLTAVCMLVKDGNHYLYTHRSFQEYFAALYIQNAEHPVQDHLLHIVAKRSPRDQVLDLLFEMDRDLVEKKVILPALKRLRKTMDYTGKMDLHQYYLALSEICSFVMFDPNAEGSRISLTARENARPFILAFHAYGYKFKRTTKTGGLEIVRFLQPHIKGKEALMFPEVFIQDMKNSKSALKALSQHSPLRYESIDWLMGLIHKLEGKHQSREDTIASLLLRQAK